MREEKVVEFYVCDYCKKELKEYNISMAWNEECFEIYGVTVSFKDYFHFCDEDCFLKWFRGVINEVRSDSPLIDIKEVTCKNGR